MLPLLFQTNGVPGPVFCHSVRSRLTKTGQKTGPATDFYPASGYRLSGTGGLYSVGTEGYSWSSSPNLVSTPYGSGLRFHNSGMDPASNYHGRALGFPVRCVQFRNRREQRLLAGYAEPPRNGAPAGGVKSN